MTQFVFAMKGVEYRKHCLVPITTMRVYSVV